MKSFPAAVVAVLSCSAVFLSSCVYEMPVYRGGTASYYGSAAAWTEASYDANGFPIFGYYHGRPVYGYTAEGVAIFTFAALTAACLVPLWAPAPWYHGHWHYPHHIHRVSAPPHFPHDHHPAMRPHGGMNAPIHKHPHQVLGGRHEAPQMHHAAPQQHHSAPQMHHANPQQHGAFRPAPGQQGPVINRREQSRPQMPSAAGRHAADNRAPQQHAGRDFSGAPQMHHRSSSAPAIAAPSAAVPGSRAAGVSRHAGGHSNASFGGRENIGHHGGHGGHRR